MTYFDKVELQDKVYSLIYGNGTVAFVADETCKMDGFFSFGVDFESNGRVFYTDEGVPHWCTSKGFCQTIWYKNEIDLTEVDTSPVEEVLTQKKIAKLKSKGNLEMQCPSGIWRNVKKCPVSVLMEAVSEEKYHMFRKAE